MQTVIIFPTQETVEVAPGERYSDLPEDKVPKVGIVCWVPAGDGTYRARVRVMENWIRLSQAGQFGIHIRREILIRLANAGFVPISQPSPGAIFISLEGLLDHIEACKDAEFWTPARREEYRTAAPSFSQI